VVIFSFQKYHPLFKHPNFRNSLIIFNEKNIECVLFFSATVFVEDFLPGIAFNHFDHFLGELIGELLMFVGEAKSVEGNAKFVG